MDGHENNRGTVGDGDLYSFHPKVIKAGHIIYSVLSDSVGTEFKRQSSS
jgi:hypothetical protein